MESPCREIFASFVLLSKRWELNTLLRPIGLAIHKIETEIAKQKATVPAGLHEAMASLERERIEDYVGLAFVACQVQVNTVLAAIDSLHRQARAVNRDLRTTDVGRESLMEYATTEDKRPSEVRTIYAFANYYKHRSEWPEGWIGLTRQQSTSAEVIRQFGATPDGRLNLTNGLVAMGYKNLANLTGLENALFEWHDALVAGYGDELSSLALL